MNITRRAALLGGISLPIAALLSRGGAFAATAEELPSPLLIALTGIGLETTPARLEAVLKPFLARQLAVSVGIDPVGGSGSRLEPASALAQALRAAADNNPELVELALDLPSFAEQPYFAMRQTSTAQAAFTWAVNSGGDFGIQKLMTALTVITRAPPRSPDDLAGLRAAGIRTVIHLPTKDAEGNQLEGWPEDGGGYWMSATGLAKTFGAETTSTFTADSPDKPRSAKSLAANLQQLADDKVPLVLHVGLKTLRDLSEADLETYAEELAEAVGTMREKETVRSLTPYTLYDQTREGTKRYVIVRVDDYRLKASPEAEAAHEKFTTQLLAAGIPLTEAVIPGGVVPLSKDNDATAYLEMLAINPHYDVAVHGLDHKPEEMRGLTPEESSRIVRTGFTEVYNALGRMPRTFIPPNNAFDDATLGALGKAGVAILSAERGDYQWIWGLDQQGILHLSHTISPEKEWTAGAPYFETEKILDFFGDRNDAVFMIHPGTINSPQKRRQIADILKSLADQPGTELINVNDYYQTLVSDLPGLTLLQAERSRVAIKEPDALTLNSSAERALKQDAVTAWQYFDRWWEEYGGLVPATTWEEEKLQGYPFATMWDIASLIHANIAAHRLGMIDQTRFEAAIAKIIEFLGKSPYSYKGGKLPAMERPIGKKHGEERRGFDSADVGRLLIALKVLDQYSAQSLGVRDLVKKWALASTIVDGEMCDIAGGRPSSVHYNSYGHYAARGYGLWDIKTKPVFDLSGVPGTMDAAMAVLGEMQRRGRIATEPHTTEEIELGGSLAATTAANALFAAQIRRYEETGIITCASEGPLDQAPWFTYQGYQLGRGGGTWIVDAPSEKHIKKTAELGDAGRLVSMKGCFLWAATRPGAYADALLAYARQNGTSEGFGFLSGVYETSQTPTFLADVNTNGIILEAISYILNGRVPLVKTSPDLRAGLGKAAG